MFGHGSGKRADRRSRHAELDEFELK